MATENTNGPRRLADIIVGGQYGDEGKGKVAAALAGIFGYKLLARGNGGTNAGHTIYDAAGKKHGLRMVSSAALACPNATVWIGPGVLMDPEVFMKEVRELDLDGRVFVDPGTALILDRHRKAEKANEHLMAKVGSTGSGTGAALADHVMRTGPIAGEDASAEFLDRKYVASMRRAVADALARGHPILVEGAQATDLSLFHGAYPFVTSCDTTASTVAAGACIGPLNVRDVYLVLKAYVTRVGAGELADEILDRAEIEKKGMAEFGVVTGRPRRVGLFNDEQARTNAILNSATRVVITKIDVLFPECEGCQIYEELSLEARAWIAAREKAIGVPVYAVSTGPRNEDFVIL